MASRYVSWAPPLHLCLRASDSLPPGPLSQQGAPGCAVLFDQEFNRKFAVETNVSFQAVDERTGLTPRDFALAEQQLERNCP